MLFFLKRKYHHLNTIQISRSALIHNYHLLQNLNPQTLICPVLKSNAYGHGLKTVAPIFDSLKAPFLCVDSLYEAWQLQKIGILSPILILGFTLPENYKVKPIPFHVSLFDLETAAILDKYQKGINVHLKIDTGMNRFGVKLNELQGFLAGLKQFKHINISGAYSHLSCADDLNSQKTNKQLALFKQALSLIISNGFSPKWKHISASAGALKIKDPEFNIIRVGLLSYGITAINDDSLKLVPAMEFHSSICQIKKLAKGETVSYSDTFKANKQMTIGIIGAGYCEGIDRRLSNKGYVMVDNIPCPILGRVCMNLTIIDLSQVPAPFIGQSCVIYSRNMTFLNSLSHAAKLCQTIPYDLLVKLNETVKREMVE